MDQRIVEITSSRKIFGIIKIRIVECSTNFSWKNIATYNLAAIYLNGLFPGYKLTFKCRFYNSALFTETAVI